MIHDAGIEVYDFCIDLGPERESPARPIRTLQGGMDDSGTVPLPRRSLRDWLVDMGLFLFAVLFGLVIAGERMQAAALTGCRS